MNFFIDKVFHLVLHKCLVSTFQEPGTGVSETKVNRPDFSVFSRGSQSSDELVKHTCINFFCGL